MPKLTVTIDTLAAAELLSGDLGGRVETYTDDGATAATINAAQRCLDAIDPLIADAVDAEDESAFPMTVEAELDDEAAESLATAIENVNDQADGQLVRMAKL